ncbi:beta-glucosidase-like glycosyl hydrolase [Mycobacterium sp. BK086]|nr:beta-glucosidase-like glycosyl hydrolase [Mycobacterium sp. BK086]
MPLAPGDVYSGLVIDRLLGAGPVGTVYLAATEAGIPVALKILRAEASSDAGLVQRLRRSAAVVSALNDPDVARVVDIGNRNERVWVATEYISGLDAGRLLRRRFPTGIPESAALTIASRVARILDHAHMRELVHGAVRPTNILLRDPFSKNFQIVVTDFGHYRDDAGQHARYVAHRYVAPEVLNGAGASEYSDQFSLAATIFEILTGEPPFTDTTRIVTGDGYLQFRADRLTGKVSDAEHIRSVFTRAFSFDPRDRFASCDGFVRALTPRQTTTATPAPHPISSPRRPQPPQTFDSQAPRAAAPADDAEPRTGRSVIWPAAAAIVVAVVLTVAAVVLGKPKPEPAPSQAAGVPDTAATITAAAVPPPCTKLQAAVSELTLRQKLAQLLMVGVNSIDDARAVVADYGVGGVFVASWTQLGMLTDGSLRELQADQRPLPLAVSVDEEGGRVQRLKSLLGEQDSARNLAAAHTPLQQVHDIAFQRGTQMRAWGITVDFAPVVDITDDDANTVIGDRSFGDDPSTVIAYAGAYASGLRDAGLLPVLKHFPGHGRASGDSHKGGVTTPPLSSLMDRDLIPYRELSTAQPVAVMVGHMQVPDLTGTDPASLSPAAYALLRSGRYGGPPFTGLVYTDDLSSMGAITQRYTVPEAVLKALSAGADVALWVSTDQVPEVLDRLEAAVNNRELDVARVDAALKNVAISKDPQLSC